MRGALRAACAALARLGPATLLCAALTPALAHEVRPAYLQIEATADHGYEVLWKQPVMGEVAVHLVPHLSGGGLDGAPQLELTSSYAIARWRIPGGGPTLAGQTVSVEGLENTITDAMVVVHAGGASWQTLLTPSHAAERIALDPARPVVALSRFVELGIAHILTGADHLLFVLGLLLILNDRWMLVKTLTAFTVAHSITLAVATLGGVQPPLAWVNAEIALSILFLAAEVVRAHRGGTSLTLRHPWFVAFLFGLLHGFGFAGGLRAAGLPPHDIPAALLLFNVGVETGQLAFVGLILALAGALRVLEIRGPRWLALLPAYGMGTVGAFWSAERVALLWLGAP